MASQKQKYAEYYPLLSVEGPPQKFFMIDGKGNPNTSEKYKMAVKSLFKLSYKLKYAVKKQKGVKYPTPPLEGLWWVENMENFSLQNKEEWIWTAMMRIPSIVPDKIAQSVLKTIREKKGERFPALNQIRIESYEEGTAAQVFYEGEYEHEGPIIQKLHEEIKAQGYELRGKHHEIYLSNPKIRFWKKPKTIIRQPYE